MKKLLYFVLLSAGVIAGSFLSSCQSSAQKADAAQVKVEEAKKDLKEDQKDAAVATAKAASEAEWKAFKSESEMKIKDNETRIAELKGKMKTSGKTLGALYGTNIDLLEKQNENLKTRIGDYEKSQSDWESFKREYNHDMEALGTALKDFAVNNKK